MNEKEKQNLAVRRELEKLAEVVEGFRDLADQAKAEAKELELWCRRMDKLRGDLWLDNAISELEDLAETYKSRKRDRLSAVLSFPHNEKETD
ncbi:MAG: hypothetical protein JSW00_08990 [Thermoplasmata archaeon]|nr:MAG: hypothetical protein JSW00_08990 [Thermoplasmata archaeon]